MKKIIITICATLILISTNVYGADLIYRLTHGDQYALVLGTVKQVDEKGIDISVEKILNGKTVGKNIKIYINDKQNIYSYEPKEGDYIVASIDKKPSDYILKWGVFKVSSLDYKTLDIQSGLSSSDRAILKYYINNGCKEIDFYYENGKVFIRKSDGSVEKIYSEDIIETDTLDDITNEIEKLAFNRKTVIISLSSVILVLLVRLYLDKRK
ncbi:hypothetical protein SAMN05661008_01892 [Alkalithermobacter thermoalcaliphilus JW-YL-7 = DSM 7308]|uniref:Uncharacterized protein n=1 Tax=Alkalithermobacter thermoalcaliphilus JW-YL-7 = DSM 7308 TaxID=1121328 RepID=A0A150FT02_CLOPD|nr:hypothetical protein JWYL7_1783 [[Clostridium] paradoxum JW-YL-7 = DSM 7308]SHL33718.1 hypothetical protein SAMN05661008_01892 [[Clostridium] paradoxum JW-YL-7 = DSM 7308]